MKSEIIFAIFCRAFVLLGPLPFTDVRSLSLGKRLVLRRSDYDSLSEGVG
jgi:hypothetical protein